MSRLMKIASREVGKKIILLGNEAIARGAIEAGISVATTYPGTPSSEIGDTLYHLSQVLDFHFEYATNEKVALEIAAAAAISNVRSLVSMKHVGLNVAADAFMTLAYVGVKGGMVIVSADDPYAHSSQNEQDNRYYGIAAGIPILEPSNPQEAKEYTKIAFELSEKLEEPVLLRTTTRVSHMSGPVILGDFIAQKKPAFERNVKRFVPVPANARELHKRVLQNLERAKEISEKIEINRVFLYNDNPQLAIITSGASINYVLDALSILNIGANILALGMTNPLPENRITEFLNDNKSLPILIVEELEPILESNIKRIAFENNIDIKIFGKKDNLLPRYHEFNPDIVVNAISNLLNLKVPIDYKKIEEIKKDMLAKVPPRPPVLCAGCPHRATYFAVKDALKEEKQDAIFTTDIGCYTLGISSPHNIGDVLLCMGSSIGTANGFSELFKGEKKVMAFIGDSTFFHAGLPALVNGRYNDHNFIVTIMDNLTTAMTGHQPTPNIEYKIKNKTTKPIDIETLVKGMGIKNVKTVNSFIVNQVKKAYKEALNNKELTVIISRGECALVTLRKKRKEGEEIIPFEVVPEKCTGCRICIDEFNCPAILWENGKAKIDPFLCSGCSVCAQICPEHAIRRVSKK